MKDKSAIIPYKFASGVLEILLIKNKDNTKWVIPKGTIEEELKPSISATKEAYEEAGVLGIPKPVLIGTYNKNNQEVPTYLLEVLIELEEYEESDLRDRAWHKVDELNDSIIDDDLLALVQKGAKVIQKNSYYFRVAIETFSTANDITVKKLKKKYCLLEYKHPELGTFEVEISRKKSFLHFSLNNDFFYPTASDIPHDLMVRLMLDNTVSRAGYWSLKELETGSVFSRMFNEDLYLLNRKIFYVILNYLVEHCVKLRVSITVNP